MEGRMLIAAQISSLYSASEPTSYPIQTNRKNVPLAPSSSSLDPNSEHACFSFTFYTTETGTLLLRALQDGLVLELASLSADVAPIRFAFPSPVLPSPALFLENSDEIHLLAVTASSSLYRIVLPISSRFRLWTEKVQSLWYMEHLISQFSELSGIVYAQTPSCVIIGMPNGSLFRMESDSDSKGSAEIWRESVSSQTSFLASWSNFLPHKSATPSPETEFVSVASLPWPTDSPYTWTLSKDRCVRVWKPRQGCITNKSLGLSTREASPGPGRASQPPPATPIPFTATSQKWLQVFTEDDEIYVLAFNPSPSSTTSAGSFYVFLSEGDQLTQVAVIPCSAASSGCHLQDFEILNNQLVVLWDNRGQSILETVSLIMENVSEGTVDSDWRVIRYADEPEYTPGMLEQVLLNPGSLAEKFLDAILVPGMFSPLTLRTALHQYTQSHLSLPGPPLAQFNKIYPSLAEHIAAVVGCTVNLLTDPQTGAPQYSQYRTALKRDWEGFIARCREVERSARWPLALGIDEEGEIIVIERERVGSCVSEDLPLALRRRLSHGLRLEDHFGFLSVLWDLREKMGVSLVSDIEVAMNDLLHQELSFSLADILADQSRLCKIDEYLDEGARSWISGRLQSVGDTEEAANALIDAIGGFDMVVKREEEEVELLLPPAHSSWLVALTAAYTSISISARYEIALCLVLYTLFAAEDLGKWKPGLLEEIFALFRGLAMLQTASKLPVSHSNDALDGQQVDDVVSKMQNMNVSSSDRQSARPQSLLFCLVNEHGDVARLPTSAHRFLDSTGLLRSISPSHATRFEVSFCEKLFLFGFQGATRTMLDWLPRTPAVSYLRARQLLCIGRVDDAAALLEKMGGFFGENSGLSAEDQDALALILPNAELFISEFSFYVFASSLFRQASYIQHDLVFCKLAISVASQDVDTLFLWQNVIKGLVELGQYEDAYDALISTPHESQRREFVSLLVYKMCENDIVEQLMAFNFAALTEEVEECLSFKARTAEPLSRPFYSKILYTWYIQRGDYRNAASVTYQRARKLRGLLNDPTTMLFIAHEQQEAYLIAINALAALDQHSAWIVASAADEVDFEPGRRRRLGISGAGGSSQGLGDTVIVNLKDLEYEYSLLSARLELASRTTNAHDLFLPPDAIVLRLAHNSRFDTALSTARSLNVDMTDIFAHLTGRCILLDSNENAVLQEDTSDWLLTDKTSTWPGSPGDRGWRYLRQALQRHDTADNDYSYAKVTLETLLTYNRLWQPPPWLINFLEDKHPEYLIRTTLRFELFEEAIQHSLQIIRKSDERLEQELQRRDSSTWLPYSLIDQVLVVTAAQEDLSTKAKELRQQLKSTLESRIKRMHRYSQFK